MRFSHVGLVGAMIALAACSQPPEPAKPLEWVSLPDGSQATVGSITVPPDQFFEGPSAAMRCWPLTTGFDCLQATRPSYNFMYFTRTTTAELPTYHDDFPEPPVGYQCVIGSDTGWQESVHSKAGRIKQNVVSFMEHPRPESWSKEEVEKLFRDNAIQPVGRWVNCKNLSKIVGETSLAAVASTEVTQALIDGTG